MSLSLSAALLALTLASPTPPNTTSAAQPSASHPSNSTNTAANPAPAPHPAAVLAGAWSVTTPDGSIIEEHWTAPAGPHGSMLGMFRLLAPDGRVMVYELCALAKEGDDTILRIRHFNAALTPWEDADKPIVLRLTDAADGRLTFDNADPESEPLRVAYTRTHDALTADVTFRNPDRKPFHIPFKRQRPSA